MAAAASRGRPAACLAPSPCSTAASHCRQSRALAWIFVLGRQHESEHKMVSTCVLTCCFGIAAASRLMLGYTAMSGCMLLQSISQVAPSGSKQGLPGAQHTQRHTCRNLSSFSSMLIQDLIQLCPACRCWSRSLAVHPVLLKARAPRRSWALATVAHALCEERDTPRRVLGWLCLWC